MVLDGRKAVSWAVLEPATTVRRNDGHDGRVEKSGNVLKSLSEKRLAMRRRWTSMATPLPPEVEAIGEKVLDAGFAVHSELGPGLLESVYATCLKEELLARGLSVEREVPIDIVYRGKPVGKGLRIDLLVENVVVVEVKDVAVIADVHEAQLLSYLRLSGRPLGYVFNFHVAHFRDGFRRKIWTWG